MYEKVETVGILFFFLFLFLFFSFNKDLRMKSEKKSHKGTDGAGDTRPHRGERGMKEAGGTRGDASGHGLRRADGILRGGLARSAPAARQTEGRLTRASSGGERRDGVRQAHGGRSDRGRCTPRIRGIRVYRPARGGARSGSPSGLRGAHGGHSEGGKIGVHLGCVIGGFRRAGGRAGCTQVGRAANWGDPLRNVGHNQWMYN